MIFIKLLFVICSIIFHHAESYLNEIEMKTFLYGAYEMKSSYYTQLATKASYALEVDLSNKTLRELSNNYSLLAAQWTKSTYDMYFKNIDLKIYQDPTIKRMLTLIRNDVGSALLPEAKFNALNKILDKMKTIYSTAKVCPFSKKNCNVSSDGLELEPGIITAFTSNNLDELVYYWKAWHDATGPKIKDLYKSYVDISNEMAKLNNYSDYGAYWRSQYEDDNFIETIDKLWQQLEPLYNDLHKYVSRQLIQIYGTKINISDGLIPAHLFGDLHAQTWIALYNSTKPFKNVSQVDLNEVIAKSNLQITNLFELAETFYESLGLEPMKMCYDESKGALIKKPNDKDVVCHASAWDLCDGQNYLIKMCTEITFNDFKTIHHEMGHIQYYLQYRNLPIVFRNGASPGFHEAIGDVMVLAISTPKHFKKIGLIKECRESEAELINKLYFVALEKVAFLPFGLLVDKWRWEIFNNSCKPEEWNQRWWFYKERYQKIKAPIKRGEEDFDPAGKFHVPADSQYISYFIAHILQFQFFKAMCIEADEYNPENASSMLHNCDFYESKSAGNVFKRGLPLGSSVHWKEVLDKMVGQRDLNASALLEYFKPLQEFLKKENAKS